MAAEPLTAGPDRYSATDGRVLLTGVQALVRLPLDQHRLDARRGLRTATLVSGYPGSPLGGLDLELARRGTLLGEHEVVHRAAVNEELAATAVWGSQLVHTLPGPRFDGVVGLWYGKAPGLDRAMDAIRHANLAGVPRTGGALALVGDDPTAKSSTVPSASEPTLMALQVPTLCPGTVQEVLDLGLHGIALSRCAGLWVGLKVPTSVADGFATVDVAADRVVPIEVELEAGGRPYRHEPTMHLVGERLLVLERSLEDRLEAARAYARANDLNRILPGGPHDRLGIAAHGRTFFGVRDALARLGLGDEERERLGIRLLHVRMPFPLDGEVVRDFGRGLEEVLVVEEKQPFLERLLKEALFDAVRRPVVVGKQDEEGRPLLPRSGELGADAIARAVGERVLRLGEALGVRAHLEQLERLPAPAALATARAPYFCSGCPHSTSVTRLPDDAVVGAGIGCHGMAVIMREEEVGRVTGLTQMGGEGAQWIGQAPFTRTPHLFQDVGDGTFHHSASLAVRASVAAGTDITYKLLWNSHVAMTGGQAPAAALSLPDVTRWLAAEGVRRTIVTTEDTGRWAGADLAAGVEVWDRARIVEAQEALRAIPGTTVLIHDQECAAEKRRRRKRGTLAEPVERVVINERVCEGCGDCGRTSNCLSVHPVDTEFGRKTQIDQASCNKDWTCLEGDCPSFLVVTPGRADGARPAPGFAPLGPDGLPEPPRLVDADGFAVRIAGIGGTGVVTVAQVLAGAAVLDGLGVSGSDQTGLAQKGGPVVSDLRLGRDRVEGTNELGPVDCDLFLAADLLVASSAKNLVAADPSRTVAVVSTARVPTGRMVVDTEATYPDPDRLLERILGRSRREDAVVLDAADLARRLVGSEAAANLVLVGAAHQRGALPLRAASIEQAIERQGTAVEAGLQAFRRGRQAVADPEGLAQALAVAQPPVGPAPRPSRHERRIAARVATAPDSELARLVRVRVHDLLGFQGPRCAARYAAAVEEVRAAEAARVPGHEELTEAFAFALHRLMAYKDEYEVARLHTDPAARRELQVHFGPDASFAYKLHPPVLRALGMRRKLTLGAWFTPALRVLAAMRWLRGTPVDPFGRAHVRRVERALPAEHRALVDEALARLRPDNHAVAVELARLPDVIRGYEHIKLAGVERYRTKAAELLRQLDERRPVVHRAGA